MSNSADVLIIGAGPSGSIASKLLHDKGYSSIVLERSQFPRFSIGESLLPQCMVFLEEAGMVDAVKQHGFQYKDGAVFSHNEKHMTINFHDKFSEGPGDTFQVQRADFDNILAQTAIDAGCDIRFQEEITDIDLSGDIVKLSAKNSAGESLQYEGKFVLDASGFGRVLPRLLDLEKPSDFPVRQSLFTHIEDNIDAEDYDRNKILVAIHPEQQDVWYWVIPFSNGRCSFGVVAEQGFFDQYPEDNKAALEQLISEDPKLKDLLKNAKLDMPVNKITGYSANVSSLWGDKFALLGNAGEFLDPVFSSGVTIAMKSASMAAAVLDKQFKGKNVDWQKDYAEPLQKGVQVFKTYVEAWYDTRFQDIIFGSAKNDKIVEMISSILAGYVWDEENPFIAKSQQRLNVIHELCTQDVA